MDLDIRTVVEDDLPAFFEHQRDPVAVRMAAFPSRDADAFRRHWERILADPTVVARTIVVDGRVAGNVVSFVRDGVREVGYWIDRGAWGRGVATAALERFLRVVTERPLHATVAAGNRASVRVLEKCGFAVEREIGDGDGREIVLRLDGPGAADRTGEGGGMELREMIDGDATAVLAILEDGIATGDATFETRAPAWEAWSRAHLSRCRLVAVGEDGATLGWAALSPVSDRCVYGGVAEVSVYVAGSARGRGVGRRLLAALVEASERHGLWTLQAGIFPENRASVAIHERCGFRVVGRRERLGRLRGRWRDVLLLERRSGSVGTDSVG